MRVRHSYADWANDIATMPLEEAKKVVAQMTAESGYFHAPKKLAFAQHDAEPEILSLDELVTLENKFNGESK